MRLRQRLCRKAYCFSAQRWRFTAVTCSLFFFLSHQRETFNSKPSDTKHLSHSPLLLFTPTILYLTHAQKPWRASLTNVHSGFHQCACARVENSLLIVAKCGPHWYVWLVLRTVLGDKSNKNWGFFLLTDFYVFIYLLLTIINYCSMERQGLY